MPAVQYFEARRIHQFEAERDITYTNVVRHRPPAFSMKSATGSRTGVLIQRDDESRRIDGAVHDSEAVNLMRQ